MRHVLKDFDIISGVSKTGCGFGTFQDCVEPKEKELFMHISNKLISDYRDKRRNSNYNIFEYYLRDTNTYDHSQSGMNILCRLLLPQDEFVQNFENILEEGDVDGGWALENIQKNNICGSSDVFNFEDIVNYGGDHGLNVMPNSKYIFEIWWINTSNLKYKNYVGNYLEISGRLDKAMLRQRPAPIIPKRAW